MNRRQLLRNGLIAMGGMVFPLQKVFAMSDLSERLIEDRSDTVSKGLMEVTGKEFKNITEEDLLKVNVLELPHIHITSFLENDFHGLTNLKELSFHSVFHTKPAFPAKVFYGLEGLERISLDANQYKELPEDVFSPLENLTVLDLSYASFVRLPKSMFEFGTLKTIIASGIKSEFRKQLENKYGSIVQG